MRFCIWSNIFGLVIATTIVTPIAFASDPDLVLHYRFDQDDGDKVVDHSSHKNDGANKFGQFLQEVRGRRGVMRFDGEKAIVKAADDSLKLKGDFTYALWMRLNAVEKHGSCTVFGTSQHFFSLSGYTNLVFVAYKRDPSGANLGMFWPIDRDMVGTDWSHITIVAEYPRMRFYRNGVLIKDGWMPYSMESPMEEAKTIYLGSNARSHGFVDLDEVAIFNRALSGEQVKLLAAGADPANLPRTSQAEILMEPFWYEDKLTMRLSAHHQFDLKGNQGKAQVTLTTLGGDSQTREVACTGSRTLGTPRTVAAADFPIKQFTNKAFRASIKVFSADGDKLGTVEKDFLLEKPAWVHNQVGYLEGVPKPWTPVEVNKTAGGNDIHIWGRRYSVGDTPCYTQVQSQGANMLAEPMSLKAVAKPVGSDIVGADTASLPVHWLHEATEWPRTDDTAATFVQRFSSGGMDLEITGHVEYDGFTRFDCKVKAREATELSELFLEMPAVAQHSFYAYANDVRPPTTTKVDGVTRTDYSKMDQSGLLKEDMAFPFTCEASVGDDDRMLVWQAESPAGWNNQDKNKAVEFLKDAFAHTLRIRFIDQSTVLQAGEDRTFTFAVFATPSKPMARSPWEVRMARSEPMVYDFSWPDREFEGKPALDHVRDMQIRAVLTIGGCLWPYPLPLGNEWFAQQIKRNVQAFHDSGIKVYSYMIHQRFALAAPEFEFHAGHMAVAPFQTYGMGSHPRNTPRTHSTITYGVDSNGAFNVCPASAALRDANVYALHKRLEYFGDDGVYLDGTSSYHWLCKNTEHGCGYVDADGKLQGTRPIFGIRDYMKRIYVTVKAFNQDHIIDLHDSFGLNSSGLFWGDVMTTGERWHHLNTTEGGVPYVAEALPLDVARHEFTGRQHNISMSVASHRLGDYGRISATTLLLDIPVYPSVDGSEPWIESIDQAGKTSHHKYSGDAQIFSLICRIRDRFGTEDAQRVLYYEGVEKYATIAPTSSDCYTTLFIHPTNGVLAFVTNHAIDEQTANVKFNLEELGLAGKNLEVLDTIYNRKLPISDSGEVSLPLKSERWTYLWLKPVP